MGNKKQKAPAAPQAKGRCNVCGHSVDIAVKVVKGQTFYTAPDNCPNCGRPLHYDVLGPEPDEAKE
jgi:rRNA maturation protein Nop10